MSKERENSKIRIETIFSDNKFEIIDSIVKQGRMILKKKSLINMTFKMMDSSIRTHKRRGHKNQE